MSDQPPSDSSSSRRRVPWFDEIIGIFVAFATIGAILFWGIGRKEQGFRVGGWQLLPDSSQTTGGAGSTSGSVIPDVLPGLTPPEAAPEASPSLSLEGASPEPSVTAVLPRAESGISVVPVIIAPLATPPFTAAPSANVTPSATPQIAVPAPSGSAVAFPDVPNDYWALPFITSLTQRGIISGFPDGTFQPDQPVTRSQYASMLEKVLPNQAQEQPIEFRDLPQQFWAAPAIDAAVKDGFLKGYPDQSFQPDQPITRLQVLLSLVNGMRLPQSSAPTEAVQAYQDSPQIPEWAVPAVASATESGLVVNYPARDQLEPDKPATRAEVSALLYQALTTTEQVPPIQSDYIVRP